MLNADHVAAINQATSSIGHAVEILDESNIFGELRDDTALLVERYAKVLNQLEGSGI